MLSKIVIRISADDLEYLRKISILRGDLAYHFRTAIRDYVEKLRKDNFKK